MTDEPVDFWQHHSVSYLEMALASDRHEKIENPDGYGKKTGECGDSVEFFLAIEQKRVASVSFSTDGCLNTNACANTVAHLCEGKTLDEAWELTPEAIVEFLQTLPAHETHCAELAVGAFYLALADFKRNRI
jgi:nitrogen fixation protein NifU and related proteins